MLYSEESRHARVSSAVQSSHQNLVCLAESERNRIARDQKRKPTASTSMMIMTTHSLTRDGPRLSKEEAAMLRSQSWAVKFQVFGLEVKFVKQRCGIFEVRSRSLSKTQLSFLGPYTTSFRTMPQLSAIRPTCMSAIVTVIVLSLHRHQLTVSVVSQSCRCMQDGVATGKFLSKKSE